MKIHQNVQSQRRNQAKQDKGHIPTNSGSNTHEDEAQAHPATAPTKAVQGGATQGAGATRVRAHPLVAFRALLSPGSALIVPKDGCMWILENITPTTILGELYK